jgi:hypothetical protein
VTFNPVPEEKHFYSLLTTLAAGVLFLHLLSLLFITWYILSFYCYITGLDRFGVMLLPIWGLCCIVLPAGGLWAWYCLARDSLSSSALIALLLLSVPILSYSIPGAWLIQVIVRQALKLAQ